MTKINVRFNSRIMGTLLIFVLNIIAISNGSMFTLPVNGSLTSMMVSNQSIFAGVPCGIVQYDQGYATYTYKLYDTGECTEISALLLKDIDLIIGYSDGGLSILNTVTSQIDYHQDVHLGRINSVVFKEYLYTAANDNFVKVWTYPSMVLYKTITDHSADVSCLLQLNNNVFSAGSGTIYEWNNLNKIATFDVGFDIPSIYVIDSTLFAAVQSTDGWIYKWDLGSNDFMIKSTGPFIKSIVANSQYVFVASGYHYLVEVYDFSTLEIVGWLSGLDSSVNFLAIDNQFIYSGSDDEVSVRSINISLLPIDRNDYTVIKNNSYDISSLQYENGVLYFGTWNGQLASILLSIGVQFDSTLTFTSGVSVFCFEDLARTIFVGTMTGEVLKVEMSDQSVKTLGFHSWSVSSIAYYNGTVISSCYLDDYVYMWDATSSLQINRFNATLVKSLLVVDGNLYTGGLDGTVTKFSLSYSTFTVKAITPASRPAISGLVTDSQFLYVATDFQVLKYDLDLTELILTFSCHTDSITDLTVLNGELVTASEDGTVKVFNTSTAEAEYISVTTNPITSVVYVNGNIIGASGTEIFLIRGKLNNNTAYQPQPPAKEYFQTNSNTTSIIRFIIAGVVILLVLLAVLATFFYGKKDRIADKWTQLENFEKTTNDDENIS